MPVVLAVGVADIFLVFGLLLMAWAVVWIFQKPIAELFSRIPVIGGQAAGAIVDATNAVARTATDWAGKAADPMVQLVQVPVKAFVDMLAQVVAMLEALPSELDQLAHLAAGEAGALADRIRAVLAQLVVLDRIVDATRASLASVAALVAVIRSATIPDAIAAVRAWAIARIESNVNALEGLVAKGDAAVRSFAQAAIAAALRPLQAALDAIRPWVLQAVAVAVRPVTAQLDGLGRALDDAVSGLRSRLGNLEGLLPLLALLPLIGTLVQVIPRWLTKERDCWDPACSFLGAATDGLGAAGELLTGSALAALVIASINDPEGTAQTVHGFEDELRPLASLVTEALAGRSL